MSLGQPSDCSCVPSADTSILYGKVYKLFCFVHHRLTPQAQAWLEALPTKLYPIGAIGVARSGKSSSLNTLGNFLIQFARQTPSAIHSALNLPDHIEQFPVGAQAAAVTKGIDAMAIPRACDENGNQLPLISGAYLLLDGEGQDLGATQDHQAILGILSRIVTNLNYFEAHQFNYSAISSLGRLIASNIVGNPRATAVAPWPHLTIVVNKYSLLPPQPTPAAWINSILQHNPHDEAHNNDRAAVRRVWLDHRKLEYTTIPLDMVQVNPDLATQLPAVALAALKDPFDTALHAWMHGAVRNCSMLSFRFITGSASAPEEPSSTTASGVALARFLNNLVAEYSRCGSLPIAGVMESTIDGICNDARRTAVSRYNTLRSQAPHNLQHGDNSIDGARGVADDGAAAQIRTTICTRHNALANLCLESFNSDVQTLQGIGYDMEIEAQRRLLDTSLGTFRNDLLTHWDHMRSINPSLSTSEASTEDGPHFNRIHHTEHEQVWFHTVTHYFWATYTHRFATTRFRHIRYNGDIIYTPWQRTGAFSEVQIAGPWHGGAP